MGTLLCQASSGVVTRVGAVPVAGRVGQAERDGALGVWGFRLHPGPDPLERHARHGADKAILT
jgi:hypothetical protein